MYQTNYWGRQKEDQNDGSGGKDVLVSIRLNKPVKNYIGKDKPVENYCQGTYYNGKGQKE